MAWQKFRRVDTLVAKDDPIICLTKNRFNFNALFCRSAGIKSQQKVIVHVDSPSFRLGFEFGETDDDDALALLPNTKTKGKSESGMFCSSRGIGSQFLWVARVAMLANKKNRQFTPKKEGQMWTIQLCPAFELTCDRSGKSVLIEAEGIYRYLNQKKEVVYIGRGKIRTRLASPERKEWDFTTVEYSIVEDKSDRERWEAFWISRHKEENGAKLPYYNNLSGTSKTSDAEQEAD